ncbi:conserved hypothetical protein [Streptomyces himastatinicus ATCC 53653]|uniref:Uncharacterized protein n=1 Tax=Streptomyces himastatinicus ATCC 53653 TaxID=457427 RepID=D9WN33_9ACTN|nr:hypothetical protein [Streptomyces himastatinicus]EFL21743.1 conserved hypothetical protein [Streptomyces himastatinicus ATCC 53653]
MSDVPTGANPAQEILADEIPSLLLRMIPESAASIAEMFHRPADVAVVTEEAWVRLYPLLAECFTTPVLMPELESDSPDTELLHRCWDFVERIVAHSTEHVSGAVHFEVLEQLLNAEGLVEAAWPYMRPHTRARTLKMLDSFDVRVRGINWR